MIIDKPGKYITLERIQTRNSTTVCTVPPGLVLEVVQVDRGNMKVIGPLLLDWTYWDLPVKEA